MLLDIIWSNHSLMLYALAATITFSCCFVLIKIGSIKNSWIKSAFHIPSNKSSTDAVLLGGSALVAGIAAVTVLFSLNSHFSHLILPSQKTIILSGAFISLIILIHGYLDDKLEIRARIKLLFQFISVFTFTLIAYKTLFSSLSLAGILVMIFFGLGVLNGCNLLDGLDTLSVKLNTTIYLGYLALAIYLNDFTTAIVTIICITPLLAYSFFNKYPAKLYLGEIGGNYIGFTFLMLSALLCSSLINNNSTLTFKTIYVVFLPLMLPMTELAISFSRRLHNKTSPFRGDKLHLHYILKHRNRFAESQVTWIMGAIYLLSISLSILLLKETNAYFASAVLVSSMTFFNIAICIPHWKNTNKIVSSKDLLGADIPYDKNLLYFDFIQSNLSEKKSSLHSSEENHKKSLIEKNHVA